MKIYKEEVALAASSFVWESGSEAVTETVRADGRCRRIPAVVKTACRRVV